MKTKLILKWKQDDQEKKRDVQDRRIIKRLPSLHPLHLFDFIL